MQPPRLIYTACPSRMTDRTDEILAFVAEQGHAPLHPFRAFPYALFEGGLPGRSQTLAWCCRLVDIADELWLFGISEGTLHEVDHLLKTGRRASLRDFTDLFDDQAGSHRADLTRMLS